jgi:hypothetical protein
VGQDLRVILLEGGVRSRPSADSLTYPAPVIVDDSVRSALASPGTDDLTTAGSFNDHVFFDVANIIDDTSVLTVTYDGYPCTVVDVAGPTIDCLTTLGSGAHHPIQVTALNQTSAPADAFISYPATVPSIIQISGCPGGDPYSTYGCVTEGGTQLTIHGTSFGPDSFVMVGASFCQAVDVVNATTIRCNVPPGVGWADVTVHDGTLISNARAINYGPPLVTRVSGCLTDVEPTTTECPTGGNVVITIEGVNFGASGGTVFVGGAPCIDVAHDESMPDHLISCWLPPGEGSNQPLYVVNGFSSDDPFYIHYAAGD